MVDLSIIILSYNTKKLTLACIESIKKYTSGINHEIIVVDNASTDGSVTMLKKLQNAKTQKLQVIKNIENLGFAAGNNQGIKRAKGRYIVLLNSDTEIIENSFLTILQWMDAHPRVGVTGCMLLNPDKNIQENGGFFPTLPRLFLWATLLDDLPLVGDLFGSYHPHTPSFWAKSDFYTKERSVDWVTGAFFLLRRKVIDRVGLMDEDFFLYVEEVEYCWRIKRAGWEVWYVPSTKVIHYGGASGTQEATITREFDGLKLLYRRHATWWEQGILRLLLFVGSFMRMIVFSIIKPHKGRMYVAALTKI